MIHKMKRTLTGLYQRPVKSFKLFAPEKKISNIARKMIDNIRVIPVNFLPEHLVNSF